jgi:phosphatidylglycerol:prolipoprotein diacylglycerol transferase
MLTIEIPWGPNITTVGGFLLTWHGLFAAVGILIGVQIAMKLARATEVDEDDLYTLALIAVPAGIVGARGLYVIENWDVAGGSLGQIIAIAEGGISVWGSLITGVLCAAAFAVWRGYDVRGSLDVAAFGMLPGLGIGRIGDLINGEHLATHTDLPWGVIYTDMESQGYGHQFVQGAVHPATTYEMIVLLAVTVVLVPVFFRWMYRYSGVTFMIAAGAYAATRFVFTYVRVDSDPLIFDLVAPQILAVVTWLIVMPIAIYWLRQGPDEERPEPIPPPGRIPVVESAVPTARVT